MWVTISSRLLPGGYKLGILERDIRSLNIRFHERLLTKSEAVSFASADSTIFIALRVYTRWFDRFYEMIIFYIIHWIVLD